MVARSLPATRSLGWWVPLLAVSAVLTPLTLHEPLRSWALDWDLFTRSGAAILAGQSPYTSGLAVTSFRWSPLVAYFFGIIAPIGMVGWTLVAFGLVALLRDWRLIALLVLTPPFWFDTLTGLSFVFVPILGLLAMRGSAASTLTLAALTVLVPRPMMLPIMAWLLWKQPQLRLPSVAIMAACVVGSAATGWTDEWARVLIQVAGSEGHFFTPATALGALWLIALPISAWLTWRGRLGLAALTISPYWTPAYLLMLAVEVRPEWFATGSKRSDGRQSPSSSHAGPSSQS